MTKLDPDYWNKLIDENWTAGCRWGLSIGFLLGAVVVWFFK